MELTQASSSPTSRSQFHSCLTFTLPSKFSSTSNVARSPAPRQSALTWMRSNLRKPEVEKPKARELGWINGAATEADARLR